MTTQRTARLHPDTMPVLVVATLLAAGLAAVSFALSFVSLRAVSSWAGISAGLAWAVPVMLDAAILVYTLAILVKRARHERATGAWATLTLWTAVSVGANAAHAAGVPETWQRAVGTVVAALAPIAVLLATHTIADLIVAPVSEAASAEAAAAVVERPADDEPARPTAPAVAAVPDIDVEPSTPVSAVPSGSRVVHRHPGQKRPAGRVADHGPDIVRLKDEGLTVRAIAEQLGLGKTSVSDYLRTLDTAVA